LALGTSFLCGAFVPAEYLPDSVLVFAHVLPSYYYIDANDKIMKIQQFDGATMVPILLEIAAVAGFCVLFVVLANIISKERQRIA
jgi:ABC-2 type transport system permease protein